MTYKSIEMRRNRIKINITKLYNDMDNDFEFFLKQPAEILLKKYPLPEFNRIISKLPFSIHFQVLVIKLRQDFIDLEEYRYCIYLQRYLDHCDRF